MLINIFALFAQKNSFICKNAEYKDKLLENLFI